MHLTTLATLALGTTGWAAYTLEDDYFSDGDFFSQFSFWTPENGPDPTNGFVSYDKHENLLESSANNAKMWVSNATSAPNGRESIRITSNKSYQSGLVILDVESMPGGVCGSWPAFWMVGPEWPNNGEIDIIEGVNTDSTNQMTLHTGPGCSINSNDGGSSTGNSKAMTGTVASTSCAVSGDSNLGCGITTSDKQSFGEGLNQIGGGVYATEWTDSGINVYFFPRSSIPSDIDSGSPEPSSWGNPMASFNGGCDFGTAFSSQQIVFDTTFCGDWAGSDDVWGQSCAASTGMSCQDYVAQKGEDFEDQLWSVNSLKVYQNGGASSAPQSSSVSSPDSYPSATAPASVPASSWAAEPTPSAPAPSSWAALVTSSAAAPVAPAPSSPAETPSSEQPTQTWGGWGGRPWQSDTTWGQRKDADGGWSPSAPANKRSHARHLRQHKRHVGHKLS